MLSACRQLYSYHDSFAALQVTHRARFRTNLPPPGSLLAVGKLTSRRYWGRGPTVIPPSSTITWPVMKAPSSEAR